MNLAEQQRAFAAHLRDPDRVPAPADIEPRRMAIYRELFFNNLVDLLGSAFPVARRILGTDRWRRLVRDFYAGHRAHTPYFLELPREFADWLRARETRGGEEPAFLDELAHYEWVELALSISEEVPPAAAAPHLSPLDQPLAVSPLAWPLAYRWPVHRLSPEYQPAEPPALPTFLVVYRDAADTVQFLEIGAETARLLDVLEQAPGLTGRALLAGQPAAPAVGMTGTAEQALADLLRRGVLVVPAQDRSDAA
ncbi:MAG TPA: putative DNA-binding domain-containing protein [Steroidobacteraceae bacterium]|nr:putative DNA-binding domain-containing protein [Steroidobacteraceae bacterium]